MARQDQTTDVLGVWQEAREAGDDPIRVLLERLLQRLLEEEMTAHLGAEPYERTEGRRGHLGRHQAADAEDAGGDAGAVGAEGPGGTVPHGTV